MIEPAYTIAEVAAMTGLSRQTVTRLFEHETRVIVLTRATGRIPRGYERVIGKVTGR